MNNASHAVATAIFRRRHHCVLPLLLVCFLAFCVAGGAVANGAAVKYNFTVLYRCSTDLHSPYGINPWGQPALDAAGNLYGTMYGGGPIGEGTIYRLDASNNYALTTLLPFDGTNGGYPVPGLVCDPQGNLYGATVAGNGNVFMLQVGQNYAFRNLVSFNNANGSRPFGGVTL